MRHFRLIFASVCAVAPIAFAFGQAATGGKQPAPGNQPRNAFQDGDARRSLTMGGNMMLLLNEKVQKDLGLTAAQINTLSEKAKTMFSGMRPPSGKAGERPHQPNPADFQKKMTEMEALVKKTLSASQQSRLKQIQLQSRGFRAWDDPDVAAKLKLTAAQKDKLEKIREENRTAMRKMFQSGQSGGKPGTNGAPPPRADAAKLEAMRKQEEAKMMAVLTEQQKTIWNSMIGKKIDLSGTFRMGNRGPGGGPGRTGGKV